MLAAPALAYRPFDSTDADVAGPGEFELELGPVAAAAVVYRQTLERDDGVRFSFNS